MPAKYTPEERIFAFWSKAKLTANDNLCWEWQANRHKQGYGRVQYKGELCFAHRIAWELTYGEIPPGMDILHSCDNPTCINPKHLSLGTHQDNMSDMVRKGRSPHGERNAKCILSSEQVQYIRERYAKGDITTRALGREMGVSHVRIVLIVNNKSRIRS